MSFRQTKIRRMRTRSRFRSEFFPVSRLEGTTAADGFDLQGYMANGMARRLLFDLRLRCLEPAQALPNGFRSHSAVGHG